MPTKPWAPVAAIVLTLAAGVSSPVQGAPHARLPVPPGAAQAPQLTSTARGDYNYAPTTLFDGTAQIYKMWFGGPNHAIGGDNIYMATRSAPASPWAVLPQAVLEAGHGAFDALHVNDPSVVADGQGTFFMYFTAGNRRPEDGSQGTWNVVGITTSRDGGHTWSTPRELIAPKQPQDLSYGAGQPSITYDWRHQMYYVLYTDTTADPLTHGGGLFAMRSRSPRFPPKGAGTEALGLVSKAAWGAGASADWAYDGRSDSFVVASSGGEANDHIWLHFLQLRDEGRTFVAGPHPDTDTGLHFAEGVALMRTDRGSLLVDGAGHLQITGPVVDPAKLKARSRQLGVPASPGDPYTWSLRTLNLPAPAAGP